MMQKMLHLCDLCAENVLFLLQWSLYAYNFDFHRLWSLYYGAEKITHGTQGSNKDGIYYYQLAHFAQKVADPCFRVSSLSQIIQTRSTNPFPRVE